MIKTEMPKDLIVSLESLNDLLQCNIEHMQPVKSDLIDIEILDEIKNIVSDGNTGIYFGKTLRDIKVVIEDDELRKHEIFLQYKAPKKLLISTVNLPQSSMHNQEYACIKDILETFRQNVNELARYFYELENIDQSCTIMEPVNLSFKDDYRRIFLDDRTWLHVEVVPEGLATNIHLVGQSEIWHNKLQAGLLNWDHDKNIVENIMTIFDLSQFPQPTTKQLEQHKMDSEENSIENTVVCGICLSADLPDMPGLPLPLCQNSSCGVYYHRSCLYQIMTERNYKQEDLLKAIEAVNQGATTSDAARKFKVPRTTLNDKIKGRSLVGCSKGLTTVLTPEEEEHLKNWLIFMAESGFPVTDQLLDSVKLLVTKFKRSNPFTNNRPGRHWFESFIKRHPEVGRSVSQNLTQSRALVTEDDRTWFKEVKDYFCTAQLQATSEDPRRIFNCDESAFFLSPAVLAKRGSKNVYNIIPSGEKECVTVLLTANASGELAPPMVLFKLKSIPHKILTSAPNDWGLGHTKRGWMTGEAFYEYIANVFYPWVIRSGIQLPIIFYLDGHCSHTTLPLSNFCRENQIILIALYPNATHILQPMDVAVFRPLKRIWKQSVYDWRNENHFVKLKKENFCPLLDKTLLQLNRNSIVNGFRKCGLSPFDANNVDYTKCVTKKLSQSTQKTKTADKVSLSDNHNHIKFFESQISPRTLKTFYDNRMSTWNGEKSLEGLFTVWKSMVTQFSTSSKDDCDKENTVIENANVQKTFPISNRVEDDFSNYTIGDFRLSEIMDYSLNDVPEFNFKNKSETEGKVEFFEVVNGTLNQINPQSSVTKNTEMPVFLEQMPNFELHQTTPPVIPIGEIIRTTGSNPIYLKPRNTIITNVTSTVTSTSISSTFSGISETTPPHDDTNFTPTMSQSQPPRTIYLTPRRKLSPVPCHKIIFPAPSIKKPKVTSTVTSYSMPVTVAGIMNNTTQHDGTDCYLTESQPQPAAKMCYDNLTIPTPFKDVLFWPPPQHQTPQTSIPKIKKPSVITSDRWQIFEQRKIDAKTEKEEIKKKRVEARKIGKAKRAQTAGRNKAKKESNKTSISVQEAKNEDWFCRLCQTSAEMDMIQCLSCLIWYHTTCAEIDPTEKIFHCVYCTAQT